jgi:hypothetical protein
MSFYATLHGQIQYSSCDEFEQIINQLTKGGWLEEGYFVDECGNRYHSETPDIDASLLRITIPRGHYRNLARFDFFPPSAKGFLVGTSTDGCFEGWVIENGQETTFDLDQWAKENAEEVAPTIEECSSENEYWENRIIWQADVADAFHEAYEDLSCPDRSQEE